LYGIGTEVEVPEFPFPTTVLATGYGEVTAEVATGFVVLQVKFTVQLLPPYAMVQEDAEGVKVPDMVGLVSEHGVFVPPLEPLHIQVQVVAPFTLLPLVPELQA
jgi:hypothetical protein